MNSDFCCSPLQWGWPLFGGHGGGPRGVPLNPIHNNNNSAFGQQSPQPPIISSFGRWCNDLHYFPMESGSIPTDLLPSAPGNEEEVKGFLLASPLSAFAAMDTKGPFLQTASVIASGWYYIGHSACQGCGQDGPIWSKLGMVGQQLQSFTTGFKSWSLNGSNTRGHTYGISQ